MTLEDLFTRITRDVPTLKHVNEIKEDVNHVIRDINLKIPGIEDTEAAVTQETDSEELTLTFASGTKTINDDGLGNFLTMGFAAGQKIWFAGTDALNITEMTIVSIQNDAATNDQITVSEAILDDASILGTLVGFTVKTNYSWDNVNKELEVKAAMNRIIDIFVDNISLARKDHDVVYDSANTSEAIYAKIGRSKIKLPDSLFGSEDGTIKIKGNFDLTEITTATLETVIDIPQQYQALLENGVLYYLLSRPVHSGGADMQKLKESAMKFYQSYFNDVFTVETNRDVDSIDHDPDYNYQEYEHDSY